MIYSLNGKLVYKDTSFAVVECAGIGYKCTVSLKTRAALPENGEEVLLYTYMAIRTDNIELFGFYTADEMECFKLITSVNGVGPKYGIAILSEYTPDTIYSIIASGEYKSLTAASGVGPKLAQRIVLELKDKIGRVPSASIAVAPAVSAVKPGNIANASAGLTSLGFLQVEVNRVLATLDHSLPTEELIKQALAKLSSGRY